MFFLSADCDVYFRQRMRLVDWGTPLPEALGMGWAAGLSRDLCALEMPSPQFDLLFCCSFEMDDNFPYNAGIMLMNMAYMRKTNKAFVDWIFAQKNGLYYEGYGAVDQGAFNQFYEKEIRGKPIHKVRVNRVNRPSLTC